MSVVRDAKKTETRDGHQSVTMARVAIRFAVVILLLGLLLFVPAGTWRWPEVWLLLLIYGLWLVTIVPWLWRHNPRLLEKRMAWRRAPVQSWDKVFTYAGGLLFIPMLVLTAFDAVRFGWSRVPLWAEILGFAVIAASLGGVFWVMRVNSFLSRIVEIQAEDGHRVITTGPYAWVRHPMYLAVSAMYLAMPPALGSWYGMIPSALLVMILVLRTIGEDRLLHWELEGYREYAARVRYRLVPGLW